MVCAWLWQTTIRLDRQPEDEEYRRNLFVSISSFKQSTSTCWSKQFDLIANPKMRNIYPRNPFISNFSFEHYPSMCWSKQVFVWLKKQLRFIYENVLEKRGCSHDEVSCDFEYPKPMHYFLCLGIVSKGTKAFEFRSITCGMRLMRHVIRYFAHKRYIKHVKYSSQCT